MAKLALVENERDPARVALAEAIAHRDKLAAGVAALNAAQSGVRDRLADGRPDDRRRRTVASMNRSPRAAGRTPETAPRYSASGDTNPETRRLAPFHAARPGIS
jgi:hypothetical protein